MKLELNKFFAANTKVDEYDTRAIKRILNRLGYYMPPKEFGSTHIPDRAVFKALKAFQKDNNLLISGELRPGDDTEKALNEAVKNQDPNAEYIWRTQRDNRVRPSHAAREGQTFTWGTQHDDGHPSEPYNCRCFAIPKPPRKPKKNPKCYLGKYKDEAFQFILTFEDNIIWPYLDTKGNITIGIGNNVDNFDAFMKLPLRVNHPEEGALATEEEKESAYETLKEFFEDNKDDNNNLNFKHDHFENLTDLRLSQTENVERAMEQIKKFEGQLENRFSDYICYPKPAKIALMDMIFNIGYARFNIKNWPSFFPAVMVRDWLSAANECSRRDVDADRNNQTRALFMEAFDIEEKDAEKDKDGGKNKN